MKATQMSNDAFTLTPALSLRERENCPQSFTMSCGGERLGDLRVAWGGRMLFPLPAGEGQGEGECNNQKPVQ
jgi:hypothetical protein